MRPLPAARDLSISCFVDPHPLYYLPPYVIANYLYRITVVKPGRPLKCGERIPALFRPLSARAPHMQLHTVVICSEFSAFPTAPSVEALYTDKAGTCSTEIVRCIVHNSAMLTLQGLQCILENSEALIPEGMQAILQGSLGVARVQRMPRKAH